MYRKTFLCGYFIITFLQYIKLKLFIRAYLVCVWKKEMEFFLVCRDYNDAIVVMG